MFPRSLHYFGNVPLFRQNPWETLNSARCTGTIATPKIWIVELSLTCLFFFLKKMNGLISKEPVVLHIGREIHNKFIRVKLLTFAAFPFCQSLIKK